MPTSTVKNTKLNWNNKKTNYANPKYFLFYINKIFLNSSLGKSRDSFKNKSLYCANLWNILSLYVFTNKALTITCKWVAVNISCDIIYYLDAMFHPCLSFICLCYSTTNILLYVLQIIMFCLWKHVPLLHLWW